MTAEGAGDRAQDVGRSHKRRRQVHGVPLEEAERLELVERSPLEAYRTALRSATWLYGADALGIRLLAEVLGELEPAAVAGQLGLDGKPMPAKSLPLADRLRLWTLALTLAGELGLTADARRSMGLEMTPPPATPATRARARGGRGPARRRVDFGGA